MKYNAPNIGNNNELFSIYLFILCCLFVSLDACLLACLSECLPTKVAISRSKHWVWFNNIQRREDDGNNWMLPKAIKTITKAASEFNCFHAMHVLSSRNYLRSSLNCSAFCVQNQPRNIFIQFHETLLNFSIISCTSLFLSHVCVCVYLLCRMHVSEPPSIFYLPSFFFDSWSAIYKFFCLFSISIPILQIYVYISEWDVKKQASECKAWGGKESNWVRERGREVQTERKKSNFANYRNILLLREEA